MSSTVRGLVLTVAVTATIYPSAPVFAQLGEALVRAQVLDETLRARDEVTLHEEPHRRAWFPFVWDAEPNGASIPASGEVRAVRVKQVSVWGRRSLWLEVESVDNNTVTGWVNLGPEPAALDQAWTQWERSNSASNTDPQ